WARPRPAARGSGMHPRRSCGDHQERTAFEAAARRYDPQARAGEEICLCRAFADEGHRAPVRNLPKPDDLRPMAKEGRRARRISAVLSECWQLRSAIAQCGGLIARKGAQVLTLPPVGGILGLTFLINVGKELGGLRSASSRMTMSRPSRAASR